MKDIVFIELNAELENLNILKQKLKENKSVNSFVIVT